MPDNYLTLPRPISASAPVMPPPPTEQERGQQEEQQHVKICPLVIIF